MMIQDLACRLRANIQTVMVGKDEVIDQALPAVLCGGHVLMEDVPGIGRTTLARALAASLDCSFQRIRFTPDLLPSDVTGINWFNQQTQVFGIRPGPLMGRSCWRTRSIAPRLDLSRRCWRGWRSAGSPWMA